MSTSTGLADRAVIVTAAAAGIGRATASAFAAEGARLVLADLDGPGLEAVTAELRAGGATVEPVTVDVTTPAGAEHVVATTLRALGTVDVLVNVVGGSRPGETVTQLDLAGWEAMLRFNLTSTFLMCQAALPVMEAQGRGAIVNVSSGAGVNGMPANPGYVAAKAGVIGLTKAMAIDHGPKGIRVNAIAPGAVLTPLMERNRSPEEIAMLGGMNLVGRVGRAEEQAAAIVWLAGDQASFMMGQTLNVNGGPRGGL